MPRQTTLSHKWQDLANAVGSIPRLYKEIGLSKMSFWRMARGYTNPRPPVRTIVDQIARRYNLPNPLLDVAKKVAPDFRVLELLGGGILKGIQPPPGSAQHAKIQWTDEALMAVAEMDDVTPEVHAAVTYLLDWTPPKATHAKKAVNQ